LLRAAAVGTAGYAIGRHAAQNQQDQEQAVADAYTAGATASDAKYDELQKLANLKEQGILTEEEFNQQKARILAS
jgi:hypothetical protein